MNLVEKIKDFFTVKKKSSTPNTYNYSRRANWLKQIAYLSEEDLKKNNNPEQLRLKFVKSIIFDEDILSLPGVTEFFLSLNLFKSIKDYESYELLMKKAGDRYSSSLLIMEDSTTKTVHDHVTGDNIIITEYDDTPRTSC